jgi:hypothetical protein
MRTKEEYIVFAVWNEKKRIAINYSNGQQHRHSLMPTAHDLEVCKYDDIKGTGGPRDRIQIF